MLGSEDGHVHQLRRRRRDAAGRGLYPQIPARYITNPTPSPRRGHGAQCSNYHRNSPDSNWPTVFFSYNKSAPATSHSQPNKVVIPLGFIMGNTRAAEQVWLLETVPDRNRLRFYCTNSCSLAVRGAAVRQKKKSS